jgi:hypothetical protein
MAAGALDSFAGKKAERPEAIGVKHNNLINPS